MDSPKEFDSKCLWKPDRTKPVNLDHFRKHVNAKFGLNLETYADLHTWSTEQYANFWEEVWHFTGLVSMETYAEVVDKTLGIADIPEWFHGSRLNFAQNLLKYKDDRVALYAAREGHEEVARLTYNELHDRVACCAAAMRRLGVKPLDRVVGYIHNGVEAIVAMLSAASIGAIWSSTSPDFGVTGVLDRFSQIQPKLLFSVNAVIYNGKTHNHLEKLQAVVKALPELEKVVVIPYVHTEDAAQQISAIKNSCSLDEFLQLGLGPDGAVPPLEFTPLPFNHPLYIMYSSGTTGVPKCMVHSAGGTLLKHLEEHVLQGNMTRDDVIMYYTSTGWMMWNWLVSSLAVGATVVCYDGSPLIPNPNVLWDLVDRLGITILGTGAKWLDVLEERGIRPRETHRLSSLHTLLSTGSPLKPQSFDYVYTHVKSDLLLGSITGGTDIIACFAGHSWTLPVHCGEIQCCLLGMAVQCWDESGKPVVGQRGELVCTVPFPSMPTSFWGDSHGIKYRQAYFQKYPDVWAHGDFCLVNPQTGGIWMLGRSDGTLNPNGVRFGSAEIYHAVESFKEVVDSLCVSQRRSDGSEERVILFLMMADDCQLTDDLVSRVKASIRRELSARHVPSIILPTLDIPYTHSGKKVEVAVKRVVAGERVEHTGALRNPDSLQLYEDLPLLRGY